MNCKDFREIADSYLSDELIVETNHEVFQHLENCSNCRQELAGRRQIREKLRHSLKNLPEFQLNPVFAGKLKAELQNKALRSGSWFNWKILVPVLALLLITVSLSLVWLYRPAHPDFLAGLSNKAVKQHEDCGLKHYKNWEKNIGQLPAEKISFVKTLENENTQILEVHDCEHDGEIFAHYVLRHHGKILSVLKIASKNARQTNLNKEDTIVCRKEKGVQTSSFRVGDELVFVISDMSEAENLQIARQLSDASKAFTS